MEMSTLAACRMCLAVGVRMYSIANTDLQQIYEKMTNILLQNDDGRPVLACYLCHHMLKRSQTFVEKSMRADELLRQIINSGLEVTEKSICMADTSSFKPLLETTPIDYVNLEPEFTYEVPVKIEQYPVKREREAVENKEEKEDVAELTDHHTQDHRSASESEDDLPLLTISANRRAEKKNGAVERDGVKGPRSVLKADASEILLTKQEQLEQLMERAKSLNYINSPYKCDLCYKGFVDTRAFENHKEKHDERSGVFSCDICSMRYRSARQLRTHAAAAHARRYRCNRCHHTSHTRNQAREHEKWHDGHTYECQLCSQKFRKPTSYLTHLRKRHPTEHVCSVCGDSFVGRHGLLMHKSKAHRGLEEKSTDDLEEKKMFCVECNIQFLSVTAWQRHIITSIKHALGNENGARCLACDVTLPANTSLRAHVLAHAANERTRAPLPRDPPQAHLPCEQCGAQFASRSALSAHVRRAHLGLKYNRNIVCELCGKKCTSNASLTYHQRTHTGEKPYPCTQCPKRFADNNQRRIHERTHSGERPYCCAVCGKRFSQKPALNRHCRVHTGAKPYACQLCAKTFSQSNSLKLHVSSVHLKLPHKKKQAQTNDQDQAL